MASFLGSLRDRFPQYKNNNSFLKPRPVGGVIHLGTRGAVLLVKWIPGVGNVANAITTAIVTEILGWVTYVIVKEGKDPSSITKSDANEIWRKAKSLREEMKDTQKKIKEAVGRMSNADKEKYDKLMKRMEDKTLSNTEAKQIEKELEELFKKYGI
jgi:gas vesicle protein